MKHRDFGIALLLTVSLARIVSARPSQPPASSEPAIDEPTATLNVETVPAKGKQEAILTVSHFGRYSVTVESVQGTALQLVDRMAGPGTVMGTAGETDGRIDAFLDRGEYKMITHAHELGTGEAKLSVHPFVEKNDSIAPILVELKPIHESLEDFEQISYWLEIAERRWVVLEAAGRNLSDLRFWKDGSWLVDAAPNMDVVQPRVGKPLRLCRMVTQLEPGLYRLTAYGGPPQAWAEGDGQHPFHLRFGIPKLGDAGRRRYTVSPFGFDRYLVPTNVNYYRLELPEARPAALFVTRYNPDKPFASDGEMREIQKESLPPVAEIFIGGDQERRPAIVTVTAEAEQPYFLQHFERKYIYPFTGGGEYWLSTIHSGHPGDSVDATGLLIDNNWTRHRTPLEYQTVELDLKTGWARRANLLAPLTVFLRVQEGGRYAIVSRGTDARFRIEPFLINKPAQYEPPEFQGSGSLWELDPGFYVLTAEPVLKGILDVAIRPMGLLDSILEWAGLGSEQEAEPVQAAVRFPRLRLQSSHSYSLYLNQQPEIKAGMVLRQLPLDLTEPLPLTQRPGETVSVPLEAKEKGILKAIAEDGSLLDLSLDGGSWQSQLSIEPGRYSVSVHHRGSQTVIASLHLEPVRLAADTPLPEMPSLPLTDVMPVLTGDSPQYFDVERNEKATYLVRADEPALYRLQTTGLLETEGNLRTRTVTSFLRASTNGVGRNFLIQQYLREGDYQITVSPRGQSRGHLGLELARTNLVEGGELAEGIPARVFLPAGQAVSYQFRIEDGGIYRLRAVGLGRSFLSRLEDDDGWPVVKPNTQADWTRRFDAGLYRVILMPEAVDTRRLTLLERVPEVVRFEGHGPHRLPLDQTAGHLWLEPEDGQERLPDVWEITLPAAVDAVVHLTNEMEGRLKKAGSDEEVAYIPPERGWSGKLEPGDYRLEVACVRNNSQVEYQVSVRPQQLVAGLERTFASPVVVPIAVGPDELVELASFGSTDVRATVLDEEGRFIAWNDDRPADWNFQILRRLPSGNYRLRLDPVGVARAETEVSMRAPREEEKAALVLPASLEPELQDSALVYPLTLNLDSELLVVNARSAESIGVSVEVSNESETEWRSIGSAVGPAARLAAPLEAESNEYRLRLWSQDRRGSPVRLQLATVVPGRFTESQASEGVELTPVRGIDEPVGVAAITLDRAGLFRVQAESPLLWASTVHQPLEPTTNDLATPRGPILWLMGSKEKITASRLFLSPEASGLGLRLPAGAALTADLSVDKKGPVLGWVYSMAGQPGIRVGDFVEAEPGSKAMAVGSRSSVAVSLAAERPSALVWPAATSPNGEPLEIRIRHWSFPEPEREKTSWGTAEGSLQDVSSRSFDLPEGAKQVRLALGEALVAAFSDGDEVSSVHWAGGEAFEETLETTASRLTLLHTRGIEDRFSIEVLPSTDTIKALVPGAPFEHLFARAGRVRIPVSSAKGTVHVRGTDEDVVLLGNDGSVQRGLDLALPASGGALLVPHPPGLILSWVEEPEATFGGAWGATVESTSAETVVLPATLVLEGTSSSYRFELDQPVMLHLRTEASVAARLSGQTDDSSRVDVYPRGAILDAYLPAGEARLTLRAVGDGALWGIAELTTSPIHSIGEGLGPEVLLPAGGTRLFSFTVERGGPVGIGVRASSDLVECILLDSAGKELGTGVVQMRSLEPGTYLLALRTSNSVTAVRARPALAGIDPPDTGPPDEVVRKYLEMAGVTPEGGEQ